MKLTISKPTHLPARVIASLPSVTPRQTACFGLAFFLLFWLAAVPHAQCAQVWNGPLITFTEPPGADPTQAVNQDRITDNVWITRGSIQGIYNIKLESTFTRFFSPTDTQWAYGSLANYNSLTYNNWETWTGKNPPSSLNQSAVLHLVSEDIYLSIEFLSWGQQGAGGFSYQRSTAIPEPAPALITLAGFAMAPLLRKRVRSPSKSQRR